MSAQPASRQPLAMPAMTARAGRHVEPPRREVVEEEQGLRALHDEVVDAHRDEVDADRVVAAALDGDLELGADAVVGRDQDRVDEAGALQVEEAAEAAEIGVRTRPACRPDERLDRLDQPVPGVDVDARLAIRDGRGGALV